MYGKLINNELSVAPKNYTDEFNTILNFNTNEELMIKYGYKPVIESIKPDYPYTLSYEENEDNITEIVTADIEAERALKLDEALAKAYDYEQGGTVEHKNCIFEMSLSNQNNLRNTQEALEKTGQDETTWNDKNDELVTLTLEDIQYIRLNLILGAIQKLWIVDYPNYKSQILEAQTIEELEAIEISYDRTDT